MFIVFRLEAGERPEDDPQWLAHYEWCECPDPLRKPLTRDRALELIDWARSPGDKYAIRQACPDDMT